MGIDSGCISEDTSNVPPLNIQSPSPCTSLFSMTSNFVWSQGGLGGLIVLFFNLPFQICTSQCTKVERSNVSCKASEVNFGRCIVVRRIFLLSRSPLPPCSLSFKERKGIQVWSLNGFSTIPSTKVFWSKGLNKSTNNRNRNNKYQNQHVIDWCVDLFEKEFW